MDFYAFSALFGGVVTLAIIVFGEYMNNRQTTGPRHVVEAQTPPDVQTIHHLVQAGIMPLDQAQRELGLVPIEVQQQMAYQLQDPPPGHLIADQLFRNAMNAQMNAHLDQMMLYGNALGVNRDRIPFRQEEDQDEIVTIPYLRNLTTADLTFEAIAETQFQVPRRDQDELMVRLGTVRPDQEDEDLRAIQGWVQERFAQVYDHRAVRAVRPAVPLPGRLLPRWDPMVLYGNQWQPFGVQPVNTNSNAADAEAAAKARKLLEDNLSEDQRQELSAKGYFTVTTPAGRTYRIHNGKSMNVKLVVGGKEVKTFCAYPQGGVPDGDAMLAQKLALENDEAGWLIVANRA